MDKNEKFDFDLEEMDKALASPSQEVPRIKSIKDLEKWINNDNTGVEK